MTLSKLLGGLNLSVLVAVSILLGSSLKASLESRKPRPTADQSKIYEDEDGKATEESQKAYSVRIQKFLLVAVTGAGFSVALVESILAVLHSWELSNTPWIDFAIWVG
jgi:hypothetical protein